MITRLYIIDYESMIWMLEAMYFFNEYFYHTCMCTMGPGEKSLYFYIFVLRLLVEKYFYSITVGVQELGQPR
jgi:hypothetical protein